jgi:hypothetical protein
MGFFPFSVRREKGFSKAVIHIKKGCYEVFLFDSPGHGSLRHVYILTIERILYLRRYSVSRYEKRTTDQKAK